jgi:hypothetical protein
MNDAPNSSSEIARMVQGGQAVIRIENESMQQLAIQRPRPAITAILKEAIAELEAVPEFAETAFYVLPFKERSDDENAKIIKIEGLSIKAAQALRRHFRNIASATRTVDETDRDVVVQGRAIDLETNTGSAKEKNVSKFAVNKKTKQEYPLRPDRLQMAIDAGKSKAERNAILALLPEALKISYFRKAKEVAAKRLGGSEKKALPIAERRDLAVKKFAELGVKEETLLAHLKIKSREEMTEDNIGELIGIFNSISDNEMAIDEAFGGAKKQEEKPSVGEALLDGMTSTAAVVLESEKPPANMVDGHRELTDKELILKAEAEERLNLEDLFTKKMKELTPRYPDKLTEGERKFVGQALAACWGTESVEQTFHTLTIERIKAGFAKWDPLADGILKRRAAK